MVMPSVGIEWSSDTAAVLPGVVLGLSPAGFQSILFGVGISSSHF